MPVFGWMRRHGRLDWILVLPDGSRSLVPASWTDFGADAAVPSRDVLGSLEDLQHLRAVTDGLVHRSRDATRDKWKLAMGRWCVQLRLQLNGEAEIPEVWATLGTESRCEVVERLAQVMVNAVVAQSGQGGEGRGENGQGCGTSNEGGSESVPRIA